MAIIVVLLIIAACCVGVAGGLTVLNGAGSLSAGRDERVKELKAALRDSKATETVAVRALRRIADPTCGAPILEATNALDTINNLEYKEIS